MVHRIDRSRGLLPEFIAQQGDTDLERSLASLRMCLGCGRWLHPMVWQEPCAWMRPEYRLERMASLVRV